MAILTYGLQCGWMSPMTKVLQSVESPTGRPLTDSEISWIASAPSLAAVFGVIMFLQIVDRYGRKICIMVVTVIQAVSPEYFRLLWRTFFCHLVELLSQCYKIFFFFILPLQFVYSVHHH